LHLKSLILALSANTSSISAFEETMEEQIINPGSLTEIGTSSNPVSLIWYFLSFIIILLLAAWGIKWMAGKMGRIRGKHLKLVESLYLGPNRGLHLIRVGNRLFLIGLADRYIELLAEINDLETLVETEEEALTASQSPGHPVYKDFSHYLQRILRVKENNVGTNTGSRLENELKRFKDFRGKQGEKDG